MKYLRKSRNLILIAALVAIVIGYITLAKGSISLAPIPVRLSGKQAKPITKCYPG